MGVTIKGTFPSRREVELAVEHLVQEYGLERTDIFVEPAREENSAGSAVTGADAQSGHPNSVPDASGAAYTGALFVSVDVNSDEQADIERAFKDAGASAIVFFFVWGTT